MVSNYKKSNIFIVLSEHLAVQFNQSPMRLSLGLVKVVGTRNWASTHAVKGVHSLLVLLTESFQNRSYGGDNLCLIQKDYMPQTIMHDSHSNHFLVKLPFGCYRSLEYKTA